MSIHIGFLVGTGAPVASQNSQLWPAQQPPLGRPFAAAAHQRASDTAGNPGRGRWPLRLKTSPSKVILNNVATSRQFLTSWEEPSWESAVEHWA